MWRTPDITDMAMQQELPGELDHLEMENANLIQLIKRIDIMCQDHGLDCVYYKDWRFEVEKAGIKL